MVKWTNPQHESSQASSSGDIQSCQDQTLCRDQAEGVVVSLVTDIPGGCLSEVMHADKHLQILGRHASSHSQCRLHLLSATFSSQCDFAMSLQNHLSVVAASNALVSSFSSYLFSVDLDTSVLISSYSGKQTRNRCQVSSKL